MLRIVPTRAYFRPGEPVSLDIRLDAPVNGSIRVSVYHLADRIAEWTAFVRNGRATLQADVPPDAPCGYLVYAQIGNESAWTAFDILNRWTDAPRYGFLYDFSADRSDESIESTLDHLLEYHVNGLQFYDWQYRHDTLLPPQDIFVDPLGRALSLGTVRALIDAAHRRSIAAMPYTAIYAASPAFAAAHHDWQLFDGSGEPFDFASGFLKLMNPCSAWQAHFVQECQRVLEALPFDGIHVDQYGEPRAGFDADGAAVNLPEGFAQTLHRLRDAMSAGGGGGDKALLFNLVHNWPVEAIASSPLDFWYSELWPPDTAIARLGHTIRENRRLNPRPAVMAVYIPPEHETAVIAAHSRILAAGGAHIAHGDGRRYLSDPYFPKAGHLSPRLAARLRQAADFGVAYEEALVFAADVTESWLWQFADPDAGVAPVEWIVRANKNRLFVHLLRAGGHWDDDMPPRELLRNLDVSLANLPYKQAPTAAWCATPEWPLPQVLSILPGQRVRLPPLSDWLMLCLEFEDTL